MSITHEDDNPCKQGQPLGSATYVVVNSLVRTLLLCMSRSLLSTEHPSLFVVQAPALQICLL